MENLRSDTPNLIERIASAYVREQVVPLSIEAESRLISIAMQADLQGREAQTSLAIQYAQAIRSAANKWRRARFWRDSFEEAVGFAYLAFLEVLTRAGREGKQTLIRRKGQESGFARLNYELTEAIFEERRLDYAPSISGYALRIHYAGQSGREEAAARANGRQGANNRSALARATTSYVDIDIDSADGPEVPDDFEELANRLSLAKALAVLNTLEASVIWLAYGLEGVHLSDENIKVRLGLSSRLQVLRTRARAMAKMRAALGVEAEATVSAPVPDPPNTLEVRPRK